MQHDHPFDHAHCPFYDLLGDNWQFDGEDRKGRELEPPGWMQMWLNGASEGAALVMQEVDFWRIPKSLKRQKEDLPT